MGGSSTLKGTCTSCLTFPPPHWVRGVGLAAGAGLVPRGGWELERRETIGTRAWAG